MKVGIMLSASPRSPEFSAGVAQAERALHTGAQVYLYCIDSAVEGISDPRFATLKQAGVHLYACAYSLQRRGLVSPPDATLAGLTVLSDILASADEFHSFN